MIIRILRTENHQQAFPLNRQSNRIHAIHTPLTRSLTFSQYAAAAAAATWNRRCAAHTICTSRSYQKVNTHSSVASIDPFDFYSFCVAVIVCLGRPCGVLRALPAASAEFLPSLSRR